MAGDPQVETYHQNTVDIDGVGEALLELWKKADGQTSEEKDTGALVRACGLTVIGIATTDQELAEMSTEVGLATTVVPARTLLVHVAADVADGIAAEVAAFCTVGGPGRKQVCHEQVLLRAQPERIDDLPSLITPLAVPDLPAVLILSRGVSLKSELVDRLLPAIDVLIADSAGHPDIVMRCRRMLNLHDYRHVRVRDLAFERTVSWREAVSCAYDEMLAEGERLMAVEAIPGKSAVDAVLLLGWIESRLPPAQRPFISIDRAGAERTTVRMTAGKAGRTRTMVFEQHSRFVVRTDKQQDDLCAVPRPAPDDRHMLSHILSDPQNDHVFDQTLRAVVARGSS